MKNLIARFVKDESGATAIEYGLIAAGISLAIRQASMTSASISARQTQRVGASPKPILGDAGLVAATAIVTGLRMTQDQSDRDPKRRPRTNRGLRDSAQRSLTSASC